MTEREKSLFFVLSFVVVFVGLFGLLIGYCVGTEAAYAGMAKVASKVRVEKLEIGFNQIEKLEIGFNQTEFADYIIQKKIGEGGGG